MTKNIIILVELALFIAAILVGYFFYQRSDTETKALSDKERETAQLNADIGGLKKSELALQKELVDRSKELEYSQRTVTNLRNAVESKDSQLKDTKESLDKLRNAETDLHYQLSAKDDTIKDLQKQIQKGRAAAKSLQEQISTVQLKETVAEKSENQLKEEIAQLQQLKSMTASKLAGLQSSSNELISELRRHIQNQEVAIAQYKEKLSVRLLDRVLFKSGSATITPEGKEVLTKVGRVLKGIQGEVIQVVGDTDNVPIAPEFRQRFASNWELSADRAAAVVRFFQETCGLDPNNMEVVGRSSYDPVASNSTTEGRAKNRNVEILIKPNLNGNVG